MRLVPPRPIRLALPALAVAALVAAQQAPTFRTTVEIVQLQVSVTDDDGRFVPGLRADDFELLVDGGERPVQVVYEVDLRPQDSPAGLAATPSAGASADASDSARLPVSARRHFLLLFDLRFTNWVGGRLARDAAVRFVDEKLHPSDLVAIAILGRRGVELVQPFIADHERISANVAAIRNRFANEQVEAPEEAISGLLDEIATDADFADLQATALASEGERYAADVDAYLVQMRALAEMLHAVRGRKQVVMFSSGFRDETLLGQAGMVNELYESGEVFREADAVLHTVDTARLRDARTGSDNSLAALSDMTGGVWFHNLRDYDVPLQQIDEATRAYYVVAYRKSADDPPSSRIEVRITDPRAANVVAPTTVAPPPPFAEMNDAQKALQLAEALADPLSGSGGIDLSVYPVPGGASGVAAFITHVSAVEMDRLASMRGDARVELEVAAYAVAGDDIIDTTSRGIGLDFKVRDTGLWIADVMHAPASGQLRVLVREAQAGEPRLLEQVYRVSDSDRQDPRLLGPVLVGVYATEDGITPQLRPGRDAELWIGAAGFAVTQGTAEVELAVLLGLEDAAGNRFRLPTSFTRKRNDGPYEERWVLTTLPAEAAAGPATLTLWVRSRGSEAIQERSLRAQIAAPR